MRRLLKLSSLLLFASLNPITAEAYTTTTHGVEVRVEPIIGYEWAQKAVPTPHASSRLTYGARATAGIPIVSAELEYTRASDTETFAATTVSSTSDTADRLKLGVRSQIALAEMLSFSLRGGVQATRNSHQETILGISDTVIQPVTYAPYAGTGLSVTLTPKTYASLELVAVFPDLVRLSRTEFQTTAGVAVRFP